MKPSFRERLRGKKGQGDSKTKTTGRYGGGKIRKFSRRSRSCRTQGNGMGQSVYDGSEVEGGLFESKLVF